METARASGTDNGGKGRRRRIYLRVHRQTLYDVPYNNTDRRKYYDTRHRFDINPYSYFESSGGGTISVSDEDGNPVLDAFDATDIPYDYIERDWRDLK